MGKPTDTTLTGSIDWIYQPPIWPVGETPKYALINILGLQPNPDYSGPAYPAAGNGNFFPIRIDCMGWKKIVSGMTLNWFVDNNMSFLKYAPTDTVTYPLSTFESEVSQRPLFGGPNLITREMLHPYYGGQFSATWISLLGPHSIWSQMRAFGFDPDGGTKLEMLSQPGSKGINRYARKSDKSCIRITMDKTYGKWWPWMLRQYYPETCELHIVLYFQTQMNNGIVPSLSDFTLYDIENSPTPITTIEWDDTTILHLKAYPLVAPTKYSFLEYIRGTNPLTTATGYVLDSWNQMYLSSQYLA